MDDKQRLCINTIRFLAAEAVEKAQSGHPGTPMGLAPAAYVLWTKAMHYSPKNPLWHNRDRFILSAGHASMLLYSMLHLTGYDLPLEELKNFRQWKSRTPGHPEVHHTPGVETTTGPLGAGLSNSVGMAIAERHLAAIFNKEEFPLVDHRTYVIASDGDLMEGVSHEAASLAGHLKLGKLIVLYDDNNITIDGKTDLAYSDEVKGRFESYGWHVQTIKDGNNDIAAIERAITHAKQSEDKPHLIILKTTIGYGAAHKANTAEAHGSPLGKDEIASAKKALGWPYEEPFSIPNDARVVFEAAGSRGEEQEKEWSALYAKYQSAYPKEAAQYAQWMEGTLPQGWESVFSKIPSEEKPIATRASSGKVLNAIAPVVQNLIQGSADLHPSTNTYLKAYSAFTPETPQGRNLHYGVREHAMGGITNGLALHGGLIPLCSTFLVFSDYMRPTIRLAAIMGIRSIFVFTHDSIGVGEDGPTHQPIEQVMSLRAIPNVVLMRPCDANEVAASWKLAIERKDGPTVLILTRQNLPLLSANIPEIHTQVSKGAYVLEDEKDPDLIFIATGSEVQHAIGAKKLLQEKNIKARVVSAPSLELFSKQSALYQESILPSTIKKRISIEAGITFGWHPYVGDEGTIIGINHFGASAPGNKVMQEFGFTAQNAASVAENLFNKKR